MIALEQDIIALPREIIALEQENIALESEHVALEQDIIALAREIIANSQNIFCKLSESNGFNCRFTNFWKVGKSTLQLLKFDLKGFV